jgi:hypothetical protein
MIWHYFSLSRIEWPEKNKPHPSLTLTKTPLQLITKYRKQFVIPLIFLMLRLMNRKKYVFQTHARLSYADIYSLPIKGARMWPDIPRLTTERLRQMTRAQLVYTTTSVTFGVMTAVSIKIRVFCDVTPCSLESIYRTRRCCTKLQLSHTFHYVRSGCGGTRD